MQILCKFHTMATTKLYLDTRRIKKDGTYPIKIMVNHKGNFLVSTDYSSCTEEWDRSSFTTKAANYRTKNVQLRNIINKIENLIFDLENSNRLNTIPNKKLKQLIEEKLSGKSDSLVFIDYLDKFLETKTKAGTKEVYITTRNKLTEFDKSACFTDITPEWLAKFENWLKRDNLKTNYISIQLRNIRAVFNFSIDNEYTNIYPFRRYKIKTEDTIKRALSPENIVKLRDYDCEQHQKKYRDMFMLIFYLIGINPVDLFQLKHSDIKDGRIEYKRAKTDKFYSIKLEPEALEIIERYKGSNYLIDILDSWGKYTDFTHRMNINLKQIGNVERVGLGGKKIRTPLFENITIYHARHSWATIAANIDISKETISAALGHEFGCDTTSIYIDFDRKKVDDANRKVCNFIAEIGIWTDFIKAIKAILSIF